MIFMNWFDMVKKKKKQQETRQQSEEQKVKVKCKKVIVLPSH